MDTVWVTVRNEDFSVTRGAPAQSNGNYSIPNVPDGEYVVHFIHNDLDGYNHVGGLLSEYYPGEYFEADAQQLVIENGAALTGIDLEMQTAHKISGVVGLDADADPALEGQPVRISAWLVIDGQDVDQMVVDTAIGGGYVLRGLFPGQYRLEVTPLWVGGGPETRILPQTLSADATQGDATGIDITLEEAMSISGNVTLPAGVPAEWMEYVNVRAYTEDGLDSYHANPDLNGDYEVVGLPPGSYRVQFYVPEYVGEGEQQVRSEILIEDYDNAYFYDDPDLVTVAGANVTGINAQLERGRTVSGSVSVVGGDAQALFEEGVVVWLEHVGSGDRMPQYEQTTVDPQSGEFTVFGVYPGEYDLVFSGKTRYETDEHGHETETTTNVITQRVSGVDATSGDVTGIEVSLEAGATLSGTVTLAAGSDPSLLEQGISVQLTKQAAEWDPSHVSWASAHPHTGNYSFTALEPGTYDVSFSGSYIWDDPYGASTNVVEVNVDSVELGRPEHNVLDVTMEQGYSIGGTVTLPEGAPAAWLDEIYVWASPVGDGSSHYGWIRPDGTYRIDHLPKNDYVVSFHAYPTYWDEDEGEYLPVTLLNEYYEGAYLWSDATPVSIDGASALGIDADLRYSRTISGTVQLAEGADPDLLQQGVIVRAEYQGPGDHWWTSSALVDPVTGDYTLRGLHSGIYYLTVEGDGQHIDGVWTTTNVYPQRIENIDVQSGDAAGIALTVKDGKTISGTVDVVAGGDRSHLEGVWVEAYLEDCDPLATQDCRYESSAPVDPITGEYRIGSLADGSYAVLFHTYNLWDEDDEAYVANSLVDQYFDNTTVRESATAVVLSDASAGATGIDAVLDSSDVETPEPLEFSVTFDANGGSPVAAQTVEEGQKVVEPAVPTRVGHVFAGWTLGGSAYDFDSVVTGAIALVASWTAETYAVTFDSQGGSAVAAQSVEFGSSAVEPEVPTLEGHTFAGWTLLGNGYNFSSTVSAPITLVASWTVDSYSVTFDPQGGSAVGSQTVEHGSKATAPLPPTRDGHTFAGWTLNGSAYDFNTAVTAAIALTASWTVDSYSVTFDSQGGSPVAAQWVEYGSSAGEPDVPTRAGYAFAGWTLGGSAYDFDSVVTASITLTANWTLQPLDTHAVTFDSNGGSAVAVQTVEDGQKAVEPAVPTRAGYVFAGWALNGSAYDFDSAVTAPIELTASWTLQPLDTHAVTFDSNGGSAVTAQTVEDGQRAVEPAVPTRAGHTFAGWKLNGTAYDFDSAVTAPTLLVASWTVNTHIVTFDSKGGSSVSGQVVDYGSKATAPSVPTRNGYTFTGWKLNNSAYNFSATVTSDITLTAGWKANAAPTPQPTPVSLSDVSSNKNSKHYTQFHTQIQWLANSGITKGWAVGGGKHEFRPKDNITREAMAAFMYRYAGSPKVALPAKSPFKDVTPQSTNFYKEIIWMNQQGISTGWAVSGGNKEFRPKDNITRDAMAAFMYRFAGKPKTTPPATSPFADVPKSSQFYKEVTWLSNAGISTGWTQPKGKPQYRPYDQISREAMAAFLYRLDRL